MYSIVSHHNSRRYIITKCIATYENAYVLYNFLAYTLYSLSSKNYSPLDKDKPQLYIS
jgi:hypothetical protein